MSKIFIDLGAYNGDTITAALQYNFDKYYGFEPFPYLFEIFKEKFQNNSQVICINKAADIKDGFRKLYLRRRLKRNIMRRSASNSFMRHKARMGRRFVRVPTIDFNKFLENFTDEQITLKIDIEGYEYILLNHLIKSPKLPLIKKIYCEWHWNKIGISFKKHMEMVNKINQFNFQLTGTQQDILSI